jgi:hypothetical protein
MRGDTVQGIRGISLNSTASADTDVFVQKSGLTLLREGRDLLAGGGVT